MKKYAKILLIAIMLLTIIVAVAACVSPTTTIAVSGEPQIVIIKGNDLDLSKIKLTVTKGSELSEIAMNAEGVTVTGFDKNSVGEQTLTITYDGATTTLKVNVIEQMVAVGHVADYVIGDKFDTTGVVKITMDNGESVNVRLDDEKIQLSGFNSDTAGIKTVNVIYTDGSLVINGSFDVTVWSADNVKLTLPTQRIYDSHDTKINTAGGYLTITANSGAVTKSLTIKEEWIQGFNPDVVTEEEPSKKQEITIDYPGQSVKYTIEIRLSDITRIQRTATALALLDWSGETPAEITDEQGAMAMRALALYNGLDEYDAELISKDDILNVVRPAAVYGTSKWKDSAKEFSGLFSIKDSYLTINCKQAEETKTQFDVISALDETAPLLTYGDILIDAAKKLGDETLYGKEVFAKYVENVCDGETIKTAISKIDLMLKMHQALADVPANWQVADLQTPEMSAKVDQAAQYSIELGELAEYITERYLFNTVSQWRPEDKDDYFEILYRYYFDMYLNGDEEAQQAGVQGIDNLIDVCMPGILETYFLQYVATMFEQYDLQYTATADGYILRPSNNMDTTSFIIAYRGLLKIRENVYNSGDEMYITLFDEYSLGNIIMQIQTADIGVFSIFGTALGEPAFDNLWTKYLDAIVDFSNATSDEEAGQVVKSLFAAFVDLSPELQMQFLSSLNSYGWSEFLVDDGSDNSTMFAMLIFGYYLNVLPESLVDGENSLLYELFEACQYYLYRDEVIDEKGSTVLQWFLESMSKIETKYGKLTEEEKTAFDTNIGFFYEKLSNIYKLYDNEGKFVEKELDEEWTSKINELNDSFEVLSYLLQYAIYDYTTYPAYISAYEYTAELYNYIIANAPQDVIDLVLYSPTDMYEGMNYSYESFLYLFRSLYINMLLEYPFNEEYVFMVWEEYNETTNLREYFASLLSFYAAAIIDTDELTDEMVKAALSGFQQLTDDEQGLFVAMDGYGQFIYYYSLGMFFTDKFANADSSEDLGKLLEDVINIEINYAFGITNQEFLDAWKEAQVVYDALSESDKAMFDEFLKEKYDYYNDIYTELNAEITAPETLSEGDIQD